MKTYKIRVIEGVLGDFAAEWMTPQEMEAWYNRAKKSPTYLQPYITEMSIFPIPEYDEVSMSNQPLSSFRLEVLDFGT